MLALRSNVAAPKKALRKLHCCENMALPFRKASSTLYVLWVPRIDFPEPYNLAVPAGARATCTDHLDQNPPAIYDCSDSNRDGMIPRAVNGLPQYVEVFDQ